MRRNQYGQPIGEALPHWQPAGMPGHSPLQGRFCRLEPLNLERWGEALYQAYQSAEDDRDWTYLFGNGRSRTQISSVIFRLRRPALTETRW